MNKNDIIELVIDDMSVEGAGIGHLDGMAFFVKDAVTGDKVRCVVTKVKKTYGYAAIREIMEPSKDRVEPRCAVSKRCGGCTLQAMSYEAELRFKQNIVRNNLKKIGGITDVEIQPVIGMNNPWNYRNKAQFPVGIDKEGKNIYGFFAARTHDIIPASDCHLGIAENREIMELIIGWMNSHGVSAYDEADGTGLIRHVLIRKGFATGQIMVCLICNLDEENTREEFEALSVKDRLSGLEKKIAGISELVKTIGKVTGMTSISISPNSIRENTIMGEYTLTIWGKDVIVDRIGDISYEISPLAFYQVNPVQTKVLYETALEYAGLTGDEVVWDLYCGIGTISLFLAQKAKKVYGVEIIPDAITNARRNAEINNITNAEFFVGAAEDIVDTLPSSDVIVVDPPRKGLDERCIDTIVRVSPKRIVYVSCDSATLARDLRQFVDAGYTIEKVQPVDQFSKTCHVETVCLLSNRKADSHIKLSLDMDEYYDIIEKEQAENK